MGRTAPRGKRVKLMRKRIRMLLIGACTCAVLILAAGCADSSGAVKMNVDGGRVDYGAGDLAVLLDSNPTTGYEWTYDMDGTAMEAPEAGDYVADDLTTGLNGAGGVQIFQFKADGSGEVTLTFTYARSWEQTDSDKTLVLKITVANGMFENVEEQS